MAANKRSHSGNNNIEGIFELLEMMLGGGLVFVKKKKLRLLLVPESPFFFFWRGGTNTKVVGNQHTRLIDSV